MKTLLSFLIGLICAVLLIYYVDGWLVNLIISNIPKSAWEWIGLIKIASWVVVLLLTGGIIIWISSLIGVVVNAILED